MTRETQIDKHKSVTLCLSPVPVTSDNGHCSDLASSHLLARPGPPKAHFTQKGFTLPLDPLPMPITLYFSPPFHPEEFIYFLFC
jgi:hypothetical protein